MSSILKLGLDGTAAVFDGGKVVAYHVGPGTAACHVDCPDLGTGVEIQDFLS
jgi:hypothetical protein